MDITPVIPKDRLLIERYGNGGFVINAFAHKGNVLLLASGVLPWNGEITPASLGPVFEGGPPEIVLIGTGSTFAPFPPGLRDYFRERGVAVDIMDTGAACRTYSVLLAEGRAVAAALISV